MISAVDLSNYVVFKAQELGKPISHLKLQKILYYIQGEYLAMYRKPLFPETIEAWAYGPVVREVYIKYVSNGALNLRSDPETTVPEMTNQEKNCVDRVLDRKINNSAASLVGATHKESPWLEHAEEVKNGLKPTISNASIYRFFAGEQE